MPALALEPLQPRECFGGAAVLSLPARFADVSDFRPVPDSQAVFADGAADESLIVEVVVSCVLCV